MTPGGQQGRDAWATNTFPSVAQFKVMGPGGNVRNRFSGRSLHRPAAFSSAVCLFRASSKDEY